MEKHLPSEGTQQHLDRLLIEACLDQNYQEIPRLLDSGADPNAFDVTDGYTSLSALVYNSTHWDERHNRFIPEDFWKTLELLLQKGADIGLVIKTEDGSIATALWESQYTMPEVAQFLLEHGAGPDVVGEEGETVLDAVEFCLWADYEDCWRDDSDYWVAEARIRKILLDHGAHRAKTLSLMAEFGTWDQVKQKICHACWHLDAESLDKFLAEDPMTFSGDDQGEFLDAAVEDAPEFMQKFFVDDPDGYEERLIATLDVLRKHGFDLGEKEGNILYYAVQNGFVKTVRYLLACGVDPSQSDCGCWYDSAHRSPEHRHYFTLADKVLHWRCRWKKETALALQELFPGGKRSED